MKKKMSVLLLPLLLAACGESTHNADKGEVKEAVNTYADGYFHNKPEVVYDSYSARCKKTNKLGDAVPFVQKASNAFPNAAVSLVEITQEIGDTVYVKATYNDQSLNNAIDRSRIGVAWTNENGTWKWDDCAHIQAQGFQGL